MDLKRFKSECGRELVGGVRDETPFNRDLFHSIPDMPDGDSQIAIHSIKNGSITILDRMTGFGCRDIESGYRDVDGNFWLASGNCDVLASNCKTFGEAVAWIKENANNCNPVVFKKVDGKAIVNYKNSISARADMLEDSDCETDQGIVLGYRSALTMLESAVNYMENSNDNN